MKKFRFSLQKLLQYRELREDLARQAYQEALSELQRQRDAERELQQRRSRLLARWNIRPGTILSVVDFAFLSGYGQQLRHLLERQRLIIQESEEIVRQRWQDWNQRRQEAEVVRRIREKRWRQYLLEADKEEQKFQDDNFIAKILRGRMA
jgi:flagellar FliJ protein